METKIPEVHTVETPAVPVPKKKRKWVKRVVILVVAVAIIAFLLSRCTGGSAGVSAGSYLPVQAVHQDMIVSVSGTGTIEPIHSYKVTALVKGEVLEAPFEEGDAVEKGDLLYRIDSKDVESSIQQQEINLRNAQLSLDTLQSTQSDGTLVKANAAGVITKLYVDQGDTVSLGAPIADILDRDHMKLVLPFHSADAAAFFIGQTAAVSVAGTLETLTGTVDSISATETVGAGGTLVRSVTLLVNNPGALTDASTGSAVIGTAACASSGNFSYASSKQVVAKASGELASLSVKEGDRVSDGQVLGSFDDTTNANQLESARLAVESAKLSLQNARDQLENYTINSTIAGTVIEKNIAAGDNIDGTTSTNYLAVVYDLSALTFDIKIDELDINKIKVGQTVEITSDALNGKSFTGVVDKININGTTANGVTSYPVTVLVNDPQDLLPGMNVSAKIIVEDAGSVLSIPVDAVARGNTVQVAGPGCMDEQGNVVDATKIETREVTLGRNDQTYIEILSGLEEGETVLIANQSSNYMDMMMG